MIVLQAYSVILQGFGVLMNGLDAFQDAAIRWFDGVKDECSYNPQANLDCILRGFTITIPFNDFLFGEGGFSNIANLVPGVNLDDAAEEPTRAPVLGAVPPRAASWVLHASHAAPSS